MTTQPQQANNQIHKVKCNILDMMHACAKAGFVRCKTKTNESMCFKIIIAKCKIHTIQKDTKISKLIYY